jgi:hypothetical protein
VISVDDTVANQILQKNFQDAARLFLIPKCVSRHPAARDDEWRVWQYPWILSRSTLRWRLAPPLPRALFPFPRPDMLDEVVWWQRCDGTKFMSGGRFWRKRMQRENAFCVFYSSRRNTCISTYEALVHYSTQKSGAKRRAIRPLVCAFSLRDQR